MDWLVSLAVSVARFLAENPTLPIAVMTTGQITVLKRDRQNRELGEEMTGAAELVSSLDSLDPYIRVRMFDLMRSTREAMVNPRSSMANQERWLATIIDGVHEMKAAGISNSSAFDFCCKLESVLRDTQRNY